MTRYHWKERKKQGSGARNKNKWPKVWSDGCWLICGFEVFQVIIGFKSISTNITLEQPNEMNISLTWWPSLHLHPFPSFFLSSFILFSPFLLLISPLSLPHTTLAPNIHVILTAMTSNAMSPLKSTTIVTLNVADKNTVTDDAHSQHCQMFGSKMERIRIPSCFRHELVSDIYQRPNREEMREVMGEMQDIPWQYFSRHKWHQVHHINP